MAHGPDAEERATLRRLFPTVDWTRVEFHGSIPLLLRWRRADGMVLPLRRLHVHLRAGLPAARRREVLVHEAWHVLQAQELGRVRFVLRYLAAAAATRTFGRRHPLEAPAYAHGDRLRAGEPPERLVVRTAGLLGRGRGRPPP